MTVLLDLADIQGNILTAYGKLGFPKGRFMLLHVHHGEKARKFLTAMTPMITTALRWPSSANIPTGRQQAQRPQVAVNIAFTWYGLLALGVPTRTLRGMPDEFIAGMKARAPMLGDDFGGLESWDEVWTKAGEDYGANPNTAHILITLNAQMNSDGTAVAALAATTKEIEDLCRTIGGVRLLIGHNPPGRPSQPFQELSAIMARDGEGNSRPIRKEHFGFDDAIGDPIFDGQYPDGYEQTLALGNGAVDGVGRWRPLATGEFLLGYPDEAQEIAGAAMPLSFSRNGAFMAYRKLHQNVVAFRNFMTETAARFGAVFGIAKPEDAVQTLMAKMAGRWSDGVPLSVAPTLTDWAQFNAKYPSGTERDRALANFTFGDDPDGVKCPVTSHMRRVNTRDGMDPTGRDPDPSKRNGSVLNNRRRILRRGLPYGDSSAGVTDADEHGIVMLAVCASLFRQFEFVQQQWINYGLDARAGNDSCPIVGNHPAGGPQAQRAKFVVPADPKSGHPPFIVEGIPQFVETRGGEYFFVPSMTALRMIGMGVIDPT